jgi:probable HAF family extracellular repeat protein
MTATCQSFVIVTCPFIGSRLTEVRSRSIDNHRFFRSDSYPSIAGSVPFFPTGAIQMRATLKIFALAALAAGSSVSAATRYSMTDLGDLPGGTNYSNPTRINNVGQVVGESGNGGTGAFLWQGGVITDLGPLPDGTTTWTANSINNVGQAVGGIPGYLWENGSFTALVDLHNSGISIGTPYDINDSGQVVGGRFLWQNGTITDLGDLPGEPQFTNAFGINNLGQVVGHSGTPVGGRAFLWTNGVMTDLGDLPGGSDGSIAFDINDKGQVVGLGEAATGMRAFIWEGGSKTDLGDLPGGEDLSRPYAINEAGQVVGFSGAAGGNHGFLWQGVDLYDLNDLVVASDPLKGFVTITEGHGINDLGAIAALGVDSRTGAQHAFLLTPVPLPGGAWLMLCGMGGVAAVTRKRRAI